MSAPCPVCGPLKPCGCVASRIHDITIESTQRILDAVIEEENRRKRLEEALRYAINSCSAENGSNTPDWVLAKYLMACLDAWNGGCRARDTWYGQSPYPGNGG